MNQSKMLFTTSKNLNETQNKVFKAQYLLRKTGQQITLTNIAKLWGVSTRTMRRIINQEKVLILDIFSRAVWPVFLGVCPLSYGHTPRYPRKGAGTNHINTLISTQLLIPCLDEIEPIKLGSINLFHHALYICN